MSALSGIRWSALDDSRKGWEPHEHILTYLVVNISCLLGTLSGRLVRWITYTRLLHVAIWLPHGKVAGLKGRASQGNGAEVCSIF